MNGYNLLYYFQSWLICIIGDDVIILQNLLQRRITTLPLSGTYDAKTQAAVKQFQSDNKLYVSSSLSFPFLLFSLSSFPFFFLISLFSFFFPPLFSSLSPSFFSFLILYSENQQGLWMKRRPRWCWRFWLMMATRMTGPSPMVPCTR